MSRSKDKFELVVIGGGAAGFAAATRADELKSRNNYFVSFY
ncbi:MAG: hypothetical protein ACK4NX_02925 [Candidatus Paceibacteria bacterium]